MKHEDQEASAVGQARSKGKVQRPETTGQNNKRIQNYVIFVF